MCERLIFRDAAKTVRIADECVTINTDFRTGLAVRELWQDERFLGRERLAWEITAELLFEDGPAARERLHRFPAETAEAVLWYMNDGRRRSLRRTPVRREDASEARRGRIFSCFWDEGLLYAAFLETYGIDLAGLKPGEMHLWRFDALFSALPESCRLVKIMTLRAEDLSALKDDRARAQLAALQALYRIPGSGAMVSQLSAPEDTRMCSDTHIDGGEQDTLVCNDKPTQRYSMKAGAEAPERIGSDHGKQL